MFIVRKQDHVLNRSGASYLVEASKDYGRKYRLAKSRKADAVRFANRKTAQSHATRLGGMVVSV
jgi:hypothetical protein